MVSFGKYLKDYLEFNNISQTEFAMRMGITQKHMNEILNGKANITFSASISSCVPINLFILVSIQSYPEFVPIFSEEPPCWSYAINII